MFASILNKVSSCQAILAAVTSILPETLWVHCVVSEIGAHPRRGKMSNPAAKMAALPKE
jgi:hypothetical protein